MIVFIFRVLATISSAMLFHLVLKKPSGRGRVFFAIGILFVTFWNGLDAISSTLPDDALWGARVLIAMILTSVALGSYFISLSCLYFGKERISALQRLITVLPLFVILPLWTVYIPNAEHIAGVGWEIAEDEFFLPFIITVMIPPTYGFGNLIKIYKVVSEEQKKNMGFFIIGLALVVFFPVLIDGVMSSLSMTSVSYGSVGVVAGCMIMSAPYLSKKGRAEKKEVA